jgi:hypothetical protein
MIFGFFIVVLLLLVVIYLSIDKFTEILNKSVVKINQTIEKRTEKQKNNAKTNTVLSSEVTPKNIVEYDDIETVKKDLNKIKKNIEQTTGVSKNELDSASKNNETSSTLSRTESNLLTEEYEIKDFLDSDGILRYRMDDQFDAYDDDYKSDVNLDILYNGRRRRRNLYL